ncbi:MAG: hypothetical protein ACXWHZ_04205 [Usitatibacter sp.]
MVRRLFRHCSIAFFILGLQSPAQAGDAPARPDEVPAAEHPFKLTLGWYRFSDDTHGIDTNLRHTSEWGNAWVGFFRLAGQRIDQWRTGWDRTFGSAVRFSPSVQLASGGFVGGSAQVEAGAPWFAGAGIGRTNLRPYYNLNFDPNDSYALSAGRRDESGQLFTLLMVRDNRENPDQRHFHFVYRQPIAAGKRLTFDALYKVGRVDEETIRRWGFTVTYDWPRVFIRLARDPNTNFTPVDAWRLSFGTRF